MNKKAIQILEFGKITEKLSKLATTTDGKSKCMGLKPVTDINEINKLQQETEDALKRIFSDGSVSFSGTKNILASLKHLEVGGNLIIEDLLRIASLLEVVTKARQYGNSREDMQPDSLTGLFDLLEPLNSIASEIRRCIISEDEIADDASSGLKDVRRHIKLMGEKIHAQLSGLLNGSLRSYLQETVITMRGDRYCLPVKAEYKNQVPGMIHDQSSTGSTLFIEPAAIVKLNNELKELHLKEEQEILKVLQSLSDLCRSQTENLKYNYTTIIELDFIFARGKLAIDMNATRPVYAVEGKVDLRQARHPLLDAKKVVPVDIRLGEDYSLLVITGPNTGGKTVSLKTCGLLALMGQAGLHIPCKDRSELVVFEEVYADIGDEQSIEQSLSTFSSHMKNITFILKHSNKKSLCLFDELCAGTDPTEGAALAIAILRDIHKKGSLCMATTHYSELKVFALTEKGVENGCCEFDVNTLSPTYRLLVGIPGKSNAFAISKKLGLPEGIIEDAKKNLTETDKSFEEIIAELESNRIALEKEREKAEEFKRQAQSMKDKSRTQSEKIEDSREKILERAKEEAREILKEAKATADETIRNFHKYGSIDQIKEMEKDRERIRQSMKKAESSGLKPSKVSEEKVETIDPKKIRKGDYVRVLSMDTVGIVSTLPDAKGNLFVQCGILRSQVNIKNLQAVKEQESAGAKSGKTSLGKGASGISKMKMSKASTASTEVNLIGMRADEAVAKLDKFLDDAYLSRMAQVRIVHGKGTGALRAAVHQHLKRIKYISEFHLAEYGEGDAGVTIAVFK